MVRGCIGLALGAAIAWPASAQQPATPQPAAPQSNIVVTGKAKRVCEQSVETGSLRVSRVCRSAGEWEEIRQAGIDAKERIRSNRALVSMQRPE